MRISDWSSDVCSSDLFVAANIGENGAYENVSEYVRDLIRQDKSRREDESFQRLKAELTRAFAAPDSSYETLAAEDVIRDRKSVVEGKRVAVDVELGGRLCLKKTNIQNTKIKEN